MRATLGSGKVPSQGCVMARFCVNALPRAGILRLGSCTTADKRVWRLKAACYQVLSLQRERRLALAATPHHFATPSIQGACVGEPARRRRVPRVASSRTRTQLAKSLCHHLIDNYCKSTALRALHAQNIRKQRRLSLLRLPIVAEAAPRLQKPPRLSAGAARGSWPARQRINKCPNLIQMKRSPTA